MKIPAIEKQLGIETFVSKTRGVGGVIRQKPEDFMVEEVLVDGSKAELEPRLPLQLTGEGRYLICLLVKHNWDTLLVARKIAKQLGVSERRVQIAGIKDKKAVTAHSRKNVKHRKRVASLGRCSQIFRAPTFRHYSPHNPFSRQSLGSKRLGKSCTYLSSPTKPL